MVASSNPLRIEAPGGWGWGMSLHQNHGAGGGNGSIMGGIFVCLCLASQNPFEWEIFVPARTDLGVTLSCSINYTVNLTIRIKPSISALSQPLRMAAHALDWGDPSN